MKRFLTVLNILPFLLLFFFAGKTQTNQTVSNGDSTSPVNFLPWGCTYNWVNNTTGIGLRTSGTGNISSFKAINGSENPVTATITVTPVPTGYAYVPDYGSNYVYVVDTSTNLVVDSITSSYPIGITISPNGQFAYVTNNITNGTVTVISTLTNMVVTTVPVGDRPYGIVLSPDGKFLYVANTVGGTVSVISTSTNAVVAVIPGVYGSGDLAISPDGSLVYVSGYNSSVSIISTATNTLVATIAVGIDPTDISFSPDGTRAYIVNTGDNTVSVVNTSTRMVVATISVGLNPYCVAISPDGKLIYVTNSTSNTISVVNAATNTIVATLPAGKGPTDLSFSASGTRLYVLNQNPNAITVISLLTGSIIATTVLSGVANFFAIGNFISSGPGCNSQPASFTITVKPSMPIVAAGMVKGSISTCAGIPSASPEIEQFTVYDTSLQAAITVSAPPGFEVSLSPGSGYGSSLNIAPTGVLTGSTIVYVRSAENAPLGNISGDVTLISTGADEDEVAVSAIITAPPVSSVMVTASANDVCAGVPVSFTASPTNGGLAPAYQWLVNGQLDAGGNNPVFTSNALHDGDSVDCVMTASLSCSSPVFSAAIYMTINPLPTVSFDPDTVFIKSNIGVQLSPLITGNIAQYQWSPAEGLSNTFIESPVANPDSSMIYQISVNSDSGCSASDKITVIPIRSLVMPNSFTPNGDGHNDVFRIPPEDQFVLQDFAVFNRWGERIFATRNISEGWNGIYKGSPADPGTYVYIITGKTFSGKPVLLKGAVVLIR